MAEPASWTTRATTSACSTASRCAPPASSSTSASTAASRPRPGGWRVVDYDKAWTFLRTHSNEGEEMLRFEAEPLPHLGWPGQAPSKVGEAALASAARRGPAARRRRVLLKDFHRRALDVGSVKLDVLRDAVLD